MNVHEAILSRRTVQRYSPEPIADADAVLRRALECAIRAPNHKLTNPWRFIRLGPKTREQIVAIGVGIKKRACQDKGKAWTEAAEARLRAKLGNPAEALVVCQTLDDDPFRRREDYASVACAMQNLMLSLHADGVGSKWATGGVTRHPETYEAVGVDAQTHEIVGFIWIGHPAVEPPETPREPVEAVYSELP